ncbi:MAG: asparagine synthase (glutamine-hydrolyzing) [Patescibacteria group bacterium]
MCGILGQISRSGSVGQEMFLEMLETLSKRGPNQKGHFFDNNIALGHRRLSVIDLSESGKQPMSNENENITIVFNGEIYNYKEFKKNLKQNHIWKSKTDTEVLIHGYEDYGQDVVKKIEGMFAFAIYEKDKQLITLARDHFGKKPLYYYLDENVFCFASEIKAIIKNKEIKKKLKIDRLSLTKYLFYGYIPSPNSIFDKIKKLEPSTVIQFDIKNWKLVNKHQYWNLEDTKLNNDISETEILEKSEELIKKAVEKRLMSDVPLGIFLSGGVDSSLIASYLSKYSSQASSFTVCYKDYPEADESGYAERVAKKLGINHNVCYFENKLVQESFLEIMDYLDQPIADAAIIPLYFISKYAKNKITVALSGDGGDEIFGGYSKYKAQKFIEDHKYANFLVNIAKPFINGNNPYYKLFEAYNLNFSARQFIFGSGSFLADEASQLLNNSTINLNEIFEEAASYEKMFKQNDIINKSLFLDCKIQLPDWYLMKADRATMAASLEVRSPLLDKELAEFVFSLNGGWKIKNGEYKYILKKLASRYVDRDIIYRNKKGFGVPLCGWIRNELKDLFKEYLFLENEFFNKKYIEKIYLEHMSEKADNSFKLLRIFNFNYWYKKYYL